MMPKPKVDRRFAKFGTVSFTAATKVNDFIDYLEQGQVCGTVCLTCGTRFFPPRADCCHCLGQVEMDWFPVEGAGRLACYSLLRYAPQGFEGDLPYAIAVLEYEDFKIFGRIAPGVDPDRLKIGMAMRTQVNQLANNRLNYVFAPVE